MVQNRLPTTNVDACKRVFTHKTDRGHQLGDYSKLMERVKIIFGMFSLNEGYHNCKKIPHVASRPRVRRPAGFHVSITSHLVPSIV